MTLVISIGCGNDELEKVKPKDIEDPPPLGMALIPAGNFEMGNYLDNNVERATRAYSSIRCFLYGCQRSDSRSIQAVYPTEQVRLWR